MPRISFSNRAIAGVLGLTLGLAASFAPAAAQAVVQPIPGAETRALNEALERLAKAPRDPGALVAAGNAALAMNDVEAAIGFFTRAEHLAPGHAPAKAGLASAHLRREDPLTAIRLFNEAERQGALPRSVLADRGLAYDLVGDNATAQGYYRQAGPGDEEAVQRLALSLAITGDKRGSEAALSPLINRQDKGAWRTRAFALAILGDEAQAVSIANATMPPSLASSIAPYLRYMRRLTPAQQAAAANLGQFPRASEIGRDDPRVAQYTPPAPPRPAAGADAGLIPSGTPLGSNAARTAQAREPAPAARPSRRERQDRAQPRERPPEPVVAVTTAAPPPSALTAPVAARPAPAPAAMTTTAATATPAVAAGPSFSLASGAGSAAAAAPSAAPAPAPRPRRLVDAFGDLALPTVSATPSPGAVDIRRITPARPPEPKAAKPAAPAHPSRIWVQVATGRDKAALAFDWRRMSRADAAVFRGKKPFVAGWGQTNRMLTGPFESEAAANAFITQLRGTDVDGAFLWTSPAGQVVDELAAK